jgi:cytochrome c oxidase subunit 2
MRVSRRAWLGVATVAGLAFLLSACGGNLPQNSLDPAGPVAHKIDNLFRPVFWIAVFVFVLVEGLLVFALVKFRHRPGNAVPTQVHGNKRLEIGWTIIPAVLLTVIAIPTVGTIFALAAKPSGNVLEVTVTAHQWWWEIEYPGLNVVTANEVHIPAGEPIYLTLKSVDVIHSFWVPRLAGTQDMEPGRTNHLTIQADQPGTYLGQCKEFCGISHANMRFRVIAQTQADFQAWVQQQQAAAAEPGPDALAVITSVGCGGCHTITGVQDANGAPLAGKVGPDLTHFGDRTTFAGATEDNTPDSLGAWLRDPQAVKPGNDMVIRQLTEDEINALVAYLESLK